MSKAAEIYQAAVARIVTAIESGQAKGDQWSAPWHAPAGGSMGEPINAVTRRPYRGMNVLNLWSLCRGNEFVTFQQALGNGTPIRKGEKSVGYVFKFGTGRAENDDGSERIFSFARAYAVFAADQMDGYTPPVTVARPDLTARLEHADRALASLGVPVTHGGGRAFYAPSVDCVTMPDRSAFLETANGTATEHYYSTLAHEMTHATGHAKRLNRQFGTRFGNFAYAVEELVAELGAAFICARLDIGNSARADHAQYLAHWLGVLKAHPRALWFAAARAQEAADLILGARQEIEQREAA